MSFLTAAIRGDIEEADARRALTLVACVLTDHDQAVVARALANSSQADIFETLQALSPQESERAGIAYGRLIPQAPMFLTSMAALADADRRISREVAETITRRMAEADGGDASSTLEQIGAWFDENQEELSIGLLTAWLMRTGVMQRAIQSIGAAYPAAAPFAVAASYALPPFLAWLVDESEERGRREAGRALPAPSGRPASPSTELPLLAP